MNTQAPSGMSSKNTYLTMGVIAIVYSVGIAGILSEWRDYFLVLTPLNLLLTIILMLRAETSLKTIPFMRFAAICWIVGYGIEVAGVHSGVIFGEYSYGSVLGLKVFDVPLIIGINWLILTYGAGEMVRLWSGMPLAVKAALSASLMVGLDIIIEPVAIELDFWSWTGDVIPLQNFIAWFLIAFGLSVIYHKLPARPLNQIAIFVFVVQIVFFTILKLSL